MKKLIALLFVLCVSSSAYADSSARWPCLARISNTVILNSHAISSIRSVPFGINKQRGDKSLQVQIVMVNKDLLTFDSSQLEYTAILDNIARCNK